MRDKVTQEEIDGLLEKAIIEVKTTINDLSQKQNITILNKSVISIIYTKIKICIEF